MIQPEQLGRLLSPVPYILKMQGGDTSAMGVYLLYGAHGKVERVSARTASEAISKSSFGRPIRVLRFDPLSQVLIASEDFNFDMPAEIAVESAPTIDAVDAAAMVEEPAETAAEAGQAPSVDAPAADAPPAG